MTRRAGPFTAEQVADTFRALAEEHAAKRTPSMAELSWRRIRARQQQTQKPRSRRWILLVVPGLAALALVSGGLLRLSHPELNYELAGGSLNGRVITTHAVPATLTFSEGSQIDAEPNTTLSIDVLGHAQTQTRLTGGTLHVRVVHRPETDWRFFAGPYEVRVIGTSFDLRWDPRAKRLSIRMHEGQVLVSGPDQVPRALNQGQSLELGPTEEALPVVRAAEPPPAAVDPNDEGGGERTRQHHSAPGKATHTGATTKGEEAWSSWVAKGRFDEVVRAAERAGLNEVLATKQSSELQALAHAARYTGNTALATRTWTVIRKRFSGQPVGAQAAFFLGRMNDEQGQASAALRWFDAYLSEAPSGVYAPEALGRKLTLLHAARGLGAARPIAREYLQRFPRGSYAETAVDMLRRE